MGRVAIYICDCMGLVSDHVDTAALEELARHLEGVVLVRRTGLLCGRNELRALGEELGESGISHLLFAGCSPRMSLKLPEERLVAAAADGGVDPALVEVANIREQCAWIHSGDREGASRKARDLLRMAHARLRAAEASPAAPQLKRRVLVVGAGPAGLAAARDLAAAGIESVLVERNPHVGGTACQLPFVFQTECWPSTCETSCVVPQLAQQALLSPLVQLHTSARIDHIVKREGNFRVVMERGPRYVDPDRCIACGKCEDVCPVEVDDPFGVGPPRRKAIAKSFTRAVPDAHTLLREACPPSCEACAEACPTDAINLKAQDEHIERRVGAVILATGTRQRDPGLAVRPDGTRLPDVVTALEFERILAAGLKRPSDGEPAEHVVFVQCAGSRVGPDSTRSGVPYCSKTCCAITAKQAKRVALAAPETEVSVVYLRDFRTYERALEKLHQDLRAMGIPFVNGEVTAIDQPAEGGLALQVTPLDTEDPEDPGEAETVACDLVVLACAQEPELPASAQADLGVPTDAFGYPIEAQPRILRPTETFVDRVYAVGSAAGPKTVQQAVEQGAVAALRAAQSLWGNGRRQQRYTSRIERSRCSGCGICLSVCPHGAIRLTDDGALADAAFCQGCGMCAASCPSHAASLTCFSEQLLLREVRAAFTEATPNEPRLLALLCYSCAYAGADLAGVGRLALPDCFRVVRIRCSSSVNMGLVLEMFRLGIDGIIVGGCPHHSCHHMWGNWLAEKRTSMMRALLGQMGLDERRLVFENIGLMHAQKFAELIQRKREELSALGPNPWARPEAAAEGGQAPWLAR